MLFYSENYSLLVPSVLEIYSASPFIPPIIDDLVLSQHIVDGSLYLDPLVIISFLSLLLCIVLRSPEAAVQKYSQKKVF